MMRILNAADLETDALDALIQPPGAGARRREVEATVAEILAAVAREGDAAVVRYTNEFDGADLTEDSLEVTPEETEAAFAALPEGAIDALRAAHARIERFHREHLRGEWRTEAAPGLEVGQIVRPLARVGVYCPGGRAAYPSTVLMSATPARVAGCGQIVMVSPPTYEGGTIAPAVLAAADIAGVDRVFKTGGAQAVAALAYGTARIPAVDKIVGPGNVYVQAAKRLVLGRVGIDMEAGPSEVLIIADETAEPRFVAADLLGQAEHDPEAVAICVTDSPGLAERVAAEVAVQLDRLPRRDIIRDALRGNGFILVTPSLDEAIAFANARAPEHLEIMVADPEGALERITHAGSIFLGPYSPNALGDYLAGPNHTLPTGGTARFASPLHTEDFRTVSSVIRCTAERLAADADAIDRIATLEGLTAHAASVRIRQQP